jgi:hypothetical protein
MILVGRGGVAASTPYLLEFPNPKRNLRPGSRVPVFALENRGPQEFG